MTYRELLHLYKTGQLDEESRSQVAADIERQDAISNYLLDESEGFDPEFSAYSGDPADAQSDCFVNAIQRSIRKAFIKMGITVGAVVSVLVLCGIFLLPKAVDHFYYNPNEVVGTDPDGFPTRRMPLDLAVYSELFLPGHYMDTVQVSPEGSGTYSVRLGRTTHYFDRQSRQVGGRLIRNKLTLYDVNPFMLPPRNALILPEPILSQTYALNADGTESPAWPGGEPELARSRLDALDEDEVQLGFVSLSQVMDYDSFWRWFQSTGLNAADAWCTVAALNESGRLICDNIGFKLDTSGSILSYDTDRYPLLSMVGAGHDSLADSQQMQTHFLSMLRYQMDHPEFAHMMEHSHDASLYHALIESVEENGLTTCGFAVLGTKNDFQKLWDDPHVSYVYVQPFS